MNSDGKDDVERLPQRYSAEINTGNEEMITNA